MKTANRILAAVALVAATAAVAQSAVENPAVKARVAAMKTIAMNTKALGDMAKGAVAFDAAAAGSAAAAIAEQAALVPGLFEAQEDDPESEAKAEIWANFDDFTAKANGLETAAAAATTDSLDGVRASLGQIGGACAACHKVYRE